MSRRRRTSLAEGLADLVARLPWWAGVGLAVASYLVLHALAVRPPPAAPLQPGHLGDFVARTMGQSLAMVGQYLVPVIGLVGAGTSAWRRRERRALLASTTRSDAAVAVESLTWPQFEKLVGEGFRRQGWKVQESGGGGADGGVDLVLTKAGERFLVQCKQWRAFKVGVEVVRELYGVMAARGAAGGFVVTSGSFTAEAQAFAAGRNVRLVDGPALARLLRGDEGASLGLASSPTGPRAVATREPATMPSPLSNLPPPCPRCGKPMIQRRARQGPQAGQAFWGCVGFPGCRGTRAVE